MLTGRPFYFKLKRIIGVLAGCFLISACASVGTNLGSSDDLFLAPRQVTIIASKPVVQETTPVTIKPVEKSVQDNSRTPSLVNQSAWSTYLREDAAAEATVLRKPTLSAEINYEGRKGLTLGFDLINLKRANLIQQKAEAKSRRYLANSALNHLIVIAPNDLTRAGFSSKARLIKDNEQELHDLKALVKRDLKIGDLNISQATNLAVYADQIIANGARASSEAAKRYSFKDAVTNIGNFTTIGALLLDAERELAAINSDIRTADAFTVNLEGGWRDGLTQDGLSVQDDSWFCGVKLSIKLGALDPARKRHEQKALRARLQAHNTEPGSVFWKIRELISAHENARDGLVSSKHRLMAAKATAGQLKKTLPQNDEAYLAQRYKVELEIINLEAEIAEVDASLDKIDRNLVQFRKIRWY